MRHRSISRPSLCISFTRSTASLPDRRHCAAIFIFSNAKELKLGYEYNLQIKQISNYYGLKEIKEFAILDEVEKVEDYKSLFLNAENIDIFDFQLDEEDKKQNIYKNYRFALDVSKFDYDDYEFDEEVEYSIVGSAEADPMNFKISVFPNPGPPVNTYFFLNSLLS